MDGVLGRIVAAQRLGVLGKNLIITVLAKGTCIDLIA